MLRAIAQNWPDEPDGAYEYAYLANDLPSSVTHGADTAAYGYDQWNQLVAVTNTAAGRTTTSAYEYDAAGNLTNRVTAAGTTEYAYDEGERLAAQATPFGDYEFAYTDWNGLPASMGAAQGVRAEYAWDALNRLTTLTWKKADGTVLRQFGYAYDAVGNITNVVADTGASRGYAYDELDRLTEETVVTGSSTNRVSWAYDLAGNRTRMTQGNTTNAYTLGAGNRLATWGVNGENGYAYDAAGCVTQRVTGARSLGLEWDAQYRLKAVRENGAAVETYGYDALGRRAWTASGSVTNYYAYDGAQVVADLDANGQVVRSYIHAPGIDRLLAIVVHGAVTTKYACLTDHLGTVHALADETGNIVETYEYDAWGNVLAIRDGGGNLLPASAIGNRYLFQGREYSWATGLYNFRARWYDPETGRWLSNDPIGISGGLNLYAFCNNNPVNFTDPDGLYGNPISGGGTEIYYPHGGWTSVNIPGATFEHRTTSGFANAYRISKPALVSFGAAAVVVGGIVAVEAWPVVAPYVYLYGGSAAVILRNVPYTRVGSSWMAVEPFVSGFTWANVPGPSVFSSPAEMWTYNITTFAKEALDTAGSAQSNPNAIRFAQDRTNPATSSHRSDPDK